MAASQPYTVACSGGLVKSSNAIDLLKSPGVAQELRNFEVSIGPPGGPSPGGVSVEGSGLEPPPQYIPLYVKYPLNT